MYINIDYYRYGYNGYNINSSINSKQNSVDNKLDNKEKLQYYRLSPGFKDAHNSYIKYKNRLNHFK
jgi:hypothetical protein